MLASMAVRTRSSLWMLAKKISSVPVAVPALVVESKTGGITYSPSTTVWLTALATEAATAR